MAWFIPPVMTSISIQALALLALRPAPVPSTAGGVVALDESSEPSAPPGKPAEEKILAGFFFGPPAENKPRRQENQGNEKNRTM
jgi:hypothetical protein